MKTDDFVFNRCSFYLSDDFLTLIKYNTVPKLLKYTEFKENCCVLPEKFISELERLLSLMNSIVSDFSHPDCIGEQFRNSLRLIEMQTALSYVLQQYEMLLYYQKYLDDYNDKVNNRMGVIQ